MPIDTQRASAQYRERTLDRAHEQILITRISGSSQEEDLSAPVTCGGLGRIRHFHRATSPGWPENPLPIDPAAHALGLGERVDQIEALVFQNAACNWRCWYCFVPFNCLSADERHSEWASMGDLVHRYKELEVRPPVLDLSGGQPELTPEMTLWTMRALKARGLAGKSFLWSDDNLSGEYFWNALSQAEQREVTTYRNYARVGCFKGFDAASFSFNTMAEPSGFDRQFYIMRRSIASGLNMYAYATFTAAKSDGLAAAMQTFVDRLQEVHPNLPLRTVPLEVRVFTPTAGRIRPEHLRALAIQQDAVAAWVEQLEARFGSSQRALAMDAVSLDSD
jgi:uncharacterized Fe-S cluster-containing radical SAM superfamily protein